MNSEALLQKLGFGEYEARAYIALLQHSPLSGYELAKQSGIPRPNIYGVLQKLEERNAVIRVDGLDGTHYAPVAPDELTRQLSSRFDSVLGEARRSLAEVARPTEQDFTWNIEGYDAVIEQSRLLIQSAQVQLTIALWHPEAPQLADSVNRAETDGVKITTLCLQACSHNCRGCRGQIYRYHTASAPESRWLIIIRDNAEMLMSDIGSNKVTGMRTRQHSLIEVSTWYVRHSIALAAMLTDLGDNAQTILTPETRQVLEQIGPGQDWLAYMLGRVRA